MKSVLRFALFVYFFSSVVPAWGQVGTADFDLDLSGNLIANGQRLTFAYGGAGMTLTHTGPTAGDCNAVFASSEKPADFGSGELGVTLCPAGQASDINEHVFGLIRASFLTPVRQVCVDARAPSSASAAVIRAYDAGSGLIQESVSDPGVTTTLCVAGDRIRRVEFSGHESGYAWFDNLTVDFGSTGTETELTLPGAANLAGTVGTRWRSDLTVFNMTDDVLSVTVDLLIRDQANPSPESFSAVFSEGRLSAVFENVLASRFGFEGAATLRVKCSAKCSASLRTYNDDPDGTFGQFVQGITDNRGITPGRRGSMTQLRESADPSTGFRSNLGLVNPNPYPIRVMLALFDPSGESYGSGSYTLEPLESIQIARVLRAHAVSTLNEGTVEVWSTNPGAVFHAYASVIDNRSGDGIYMPAVLE